MGFKYASNGPLQELKRSVTIGSMDAIKKLIRSGMTRKQIALSIGLNEPTLVGMYERGERFPGRDNFRAIVNLAESRGLTLLARDFLPEEKAKRATCAVSMPGAKAA